MTIYKDSHFIDLNHNKGEREKMDFEVNDSGTKRFFF